jgi:hypothetical protein
MGERDRRDLSVPQPQAKGAPWALRKGKPHETLWSFVLRSPARVAMLIMMSPVLACGGKLSSMMTGRLASRVQCGGLCPGPIAVATWAAPWRTGDGDPCVVPDLGALALQPVQPGRR